MEEGVFVNINQHLVDRSGSVVVLDASKHVNFLEYIKASEDNKTDIKFFSNKNIEILTETDDDISLLKKSSKATYAIKETRPAVLKRPKNYVCSDCGIGFVSNKDLSRHKVIHTG